MRVCTTYLYFVTWGGLPKVATELILISWAKIQLMLLSPWWLVSLPGSLCTAAVTDNKAQDGRERLITSTTMGFSNVAENGKR